MALALLSMAVASLEDPYARAVRLVGKMTLDEKLGFVQQNRTKHPNSGYTGVISAVPRLGIPALRMNDGPEGFRGLAGTSTQWLSGLTLAHSFDAALFGEYGEAVAEEFSGKGANCQFGPGVNLARLPNGGRSFEYLSGEDPFLGSVLVQPFVAGVQSRGVISNVKHFIDNNQEGVAASGAGDRHTSSMVVDERTEMEMYFPPFEGALNAGALSVMCANNMVNGVYVCENNSTENGLLRAHGGFKGWVCSDYDGTRSTIDAANHGLDIAMPGPAGEAAAADADDDVAAHSSGGMGMGRPDYFGAPLRAAIESGYVSEASFLSFTVTFYADLANNLTRSP
jgi:beta-glucosidase